MICPHDRVPRLAAAALAAVLLAACPHGAAPAPAATIAQAFPGEAPPPPPGTCGGPTPAGGPRTIRDVDWCNRTYRGVGDAPREVAGGRFEEEMQIAANRKATAFLDRWQIADVAYGDLDGDGEEDAAVAIEEYHSHSPFTEVSHVTDIRVYTLRGGAPVRIARVFVDGAPDARLAVPPVDAIHGGVLTRTWRWRGASSCVDRWRLRNGALERVTPRCT